MYTEPIAPELCSFEVEVAIEILKRCKSPGIDEIRNQYVKHYVLRSVNASVSFGVRNYCVRSGTNVLLCLFT
jgi:hypothetical protein